MVEACAFGGIWPKFDSVTFFSVLTVLIFMVILDLWNMSVMTLASFNPAAYTLIIFMCIATLLVYSMYFTERKAT